MKKNLENNIHRHELSITKEMREKLNCHKPCILFLTGLSGSGKSTIANALEVQLHKSGFHTFILDGDNIRIGLNKDLGFSNEDRKENIRRISEVAKLFADSGVIVITAFISPFIEDRQIARDILSKDFKFIEVFVNAKLETCESRDPKGLYKKARIGQIKNFTGIDSPYEAPISPEVILETDKYDQRMCVYILIHYLFENGIISTCSSIDAVEEINKILTEELNKVK